MNGSWTELGWGALLSAGAALAVLLVAFVIGVARGLHRVVDVAWGIAFVAVALVSYGTSVGHGAPGRRALVTVLTVLWGLRLATHIARRGRGHGEDPRYARILDRAPNSRGAYAFRKVYLLQGVLVWIVALPVQFAQFTAGPIGGTALLGTGLWAVGLTFEAVGDFQLARFREDPANRGRIMDRGLWSWTRHPNYFGDFLVWWGLYLVACDTWPGRFTVLSPLLMSFLLTRGSGKRLLEEHLADRPGYADYRSRTSGFFPRPPRSGRA